MLKKTPILREATYYLKHSQVLLDIGSLIGMYVHTYLYQKYYKQSDLNNPSQTFFIFIKLLILNDLIYTFTKYSSLSTIRTTFKKIFFNIIIPIVLLYLNLSEFGSLEISGYTKTFNLFKWIWLFMNMFKIMFIYNKLTYVADLIKLFDTIWLVNMILISITDPITNNAEYPNLVIFYEVYFNYLEFHILILASILIFNDKNIEDDVKYSENSVSLFTTSALLGKHDSYRYSVILLFSHYYFVIVNGLSYGLCHLVGLSSIFITFAIILSYRQHRMTKVYFLQVMLLACNLVCYSWALTNISQKKEDLSNI